MPLTTPFADAVIGVLHKGDERQTVSSLTHVLDGQMDDANAVAMLLDLIGFIPSVGSVLTDFFHDLDDHLVSGYRATAGYTGQYRSEESEHQAARNLALLGCPQCSDLAIWRINSKWRDTEHFPYLLASIGWKPSKRQLYRFSRNSGHWKSSHSDFSAALAAYLRCAESVENPFLIIDEVKLPTLIRVLNTMHIEDTLPAERLKSLFDLYRTSNEMTSLDDVAFLTQLIGKHGLEKYVALRLDDLVEDFFLRDIGL